MVVKRRVLWILLVGFLRLVQQSLGLRLTIDSRLNIGEHDCYTRMLIGSKFCEHTLISTMEIFLPDLSRCEELCSKRGEACKAFTFGVGRKGNATCTLAPEVPTVRDLQTDSDYDVYVKEPPGNCIKSVDGFSKRLFHQSQDAWRCTDPQCLPVDEPESQIVQEYKPYAGIVTPNIASQHYAYSKLHLANYPTQADGESWSGDIYSNRFQALPIPAGSTSDSPTDFEDEAFQYSYPDELSNFRRYTVTGQACRNGTECQENQLAGFWACDLERADDGTWDYCCAPRHQCGFSLGFQYPWCYVGRRDDQWRLCSGAFHVHVDFSNYKSQQGTNHREALPSWLSYRSDYYRCRLRKRYWPILYLHTNPPPNCTAFYT